MADGPAITKKTDEIDPFDDMKTRFSAAFEANEACTVRVTKKNELTGKWESLPPYEVPNLDFDAFENDLRDDYPDGGWFQLKAVAGGQVRSASSLTMAPTPQRLRKKVAVETPGTPARSKPDDLMTYIITQQTAQQNLLLAVAEIAAPIVIALIKNGQGQTKNDPIALLREMRALDKENGSNPMAAMRDALSMAKEAREALGDSGGGGGIFEKLAEKALPLLGAMGAAQPQPVAPPPQQMTGPRPAPAIRQQPAAQPQPAAVESPAVQPQPATPQDVGGAQAFNLLLQDLVVLIHDGMSPEALHFHVMLQMQLGKVDGDDLRPILQSAIDNPDNARALLGLFGISEPAHFDVAQSTFSLLCVSLEIQPSTGGRSGDAASLAGHGESGEMGQDEAGDGGAG